MLKLGLFKQVLQRIINLFFEWFGKLFDFVSSVSDIIFSTMAVFKFIVIDHWFSLIVLYECDYGICCITKQGYILSAGRCSDTIKRYLKP